MNFIRCTGRQLREAASQAEDDQQIVLTQRDDSEKLGVLAIESHGSQGPGSVIDTKGGSQRDSWLTGFKS
jgi:hypothetical protein